MQILVDRDSVAMGDDVEGHQRIVEVPDDATVEELLRTVTPDVSVNGGSTWICCWNDVPFAVHASAWGEGRVWDQRYRTLADLPTDIPAGEGADVRTPRLVFRYWLQMDPDWLLAQLHGGHPLDRQALRTRWDAIAEERAVAAMRAHEPFVRTPLLDRATVQVLTALGARIDVHTEDVCRLFVGPQVWTVQRSHPVTWILTPGGVRGELHVRELLPQWLTALIGSTLVGTCALPDPVTGTEVEHRYGRVGVWRATGEEPGRQELAEFGADREADVALFQRTVGRTVKEVAAAYGIGPRPALTLELLVAREAEAVARAETQTRTAGGRQGPSRPLSWWTRTRTRARARARGRR
ncbi:hypothetical protein [Kineococcus radiotolerans]|uniref:Uncharacterized protein n=1 Tax=Kineococcus radiotolerans (strain ATCC BAA-149 / DSM 14245 / SRS30216) TaxID=266940 RepID=A6WBW3_KINRD|nr:hypothetical protein [Kineococcus radiotolerans]ABS04302.1 hypothetical protein Krad_2834 [Kineococcus radiotolerans SRS30216 = ATCC BAA-149]